MENVKKKFLTILRNKKTTRAEFRRTADALSQILAQEAATYIPIKEITIETPIAKTTGISFASSVMLVPILRSGITMVNPFLHYFENATIGVVGLKRDEKTAQAHLYYNNIPPIEPGTKVIILDPMIATGGTGVETLHILKEKGVKQKDIIFASIVCAPEGINVIKKDFPEITIINASVDIQLNKEKFIVPGLGDFGDRYFGTE